ncbi:potassium-transporting ATPase subunit KdpC [Neochlamydia sp. AcF95]|uniref:potassium-transporting ATPase subunit KdpC n=1 Tax=Neochlamydia sp. AcF95 TaxID=2795734 RepID=UPI001BD826BA|nr:potassium-transporting ATPase subunit KdpC [Neochlamydia sp. AcF95]MBS4170596.1 Potassium-transporting ATPase KdpC subunit [Neochlamydia sp. AcF95]
MLRIWTSFKMFLWLTALTGIIYPFFITFIAYLTIKNKAEGDFISFNGKVVGAALIGQNFESNRYFWGRPSANNYNPLASGGSNLSPTSEALKKAIEKRKAKIKKNYDEKSDRLIPSELLFASASGLDPHISPQTAYFQVERIIKARGWNENNKEAIFRLIEASIELPRWGFLGAPYINVLKLNLALDAWDKAQKE